MNKMIVSLLFISSLLGLSACGSDQPDNVGTSADIVVNNREVVMAGAAAPALPSVPAPVMEEGEASAAPATPVVTEGQAVDVNPPVQPAASEDQSVKAQQ